MTDHSFTLGDKTYRVTVKRGDGRAKKARLYVHELTAGKGTPYDEELQALADRLGAPSIYTTRGTYPTLDAMWDEANKWVVLDNRRVAVRALFELGCVDEFAEHAPNDVIKFSRNAGCACGCSPGFILQTIYDRDIFVTELEK